MAFCFCTRHRLYQHQGLGPCVIVELFTNNLLIYLFIYYKYVFTDIIFF